MKSGDWKGLVQGIINNDEEAVTYYLSSDINLNYAHPEMMTTPLIEACRYSHLEIVRQLLERGAKPKFQSQLGESPFKLAKQNKNEQLLTLLKKYRWSPLSFHQSFEEINKLLLPFFPRF